MLCAAALLLRDGGCSPPSSSAGARTVLVVLDTLRADHLGCYGHPGARTPWLDRAARTGIQFRTAISHVPVTAPSLGTLFTGTLPTHHGVRDNGFFTLGPDVPTLAERFREAGRATGAFVSAAVLERRYGLDRGFDTYDDDLSTPYRFHRDDLRPNETGHQNTERRGRETIARTAAWIRDQAGRPFFLAVHLFDPHDPYDPPPPWSPGPERTLYDDEITETDRCVGLLLRALDGADGPAPVVSILADHGEGLGEHGESTHGFLLHDATVRVPWILTGTGRAGLHVPPRRLVDVAPTLLGLAGLDPGAAQGRSLAEALAEAPGAASGPAPPAYLETYRTFYSYDWSEMVGWRTADWKLVRAPRPELYDLAADPRENVNRWEARPDRVEELGAQLDARIRETARRQAEPDAPDDETRRRLEALGYVSGGSPGGTAGSGSRLDPKDGLLGFERRQRAKVRLIDGRNLVEHGQPAEAERAIRDAIALAPDYAMGYFDLARLQAGRGETDAAERNLALALRLDPEFAEAWTVRALLAYSAGRDSVAAESFRRAWDAAPEPWSRRNLAEFLIRTGRWEEALDWTDEIRRTGTDDDWARSARAYVLHRAGRWSEEAALWNDAAAEGPTDDPTARFRSVALEVHAASGPAGRALAEERWDDARPELERAHAARPESGPVAWALARTLVAAGRRARAEELLLGTVDPDPVRDAHRALALAELRIAGGRADEAIAVLSPALDATEGVYAPFRARLWYVAGRAAFAAGRPDAATLLTKALDDSFGSAWEEKAVARGGRRLMNRTPETSAR